MAKFEKTKMQNVMFFCVVLIESGVILMLNETAGDIKQLVYFPCSIDVTAQIWLLTVFF